MSDTIDLRLRYPFERDPVAPENHHKSFTEKIQRPYGDSMRQIIAMPLGFSDNHPGAHVQLVDTEAVVSTKASIADQPFHTTALHRIFSKDLTENTIRERIVPAICDRLNEITASQQDPITIESHFDPQTHMDAAHWEPDPENMSIRFVSANTTPKSFFIRIETRSNRSVGQELHGIAENMTASEYANDPRVQWSANLQKRTIGRLLDICSDVVESYTKDPIAERVEDRMAKVSAHEMAPKLALHNGPMSVANTVRFIEPQYKSSPIQNDPRTKGMVGFYFNCVGEASKGVLLEGNHDDPIYEMHGIPEVDPTQKGMDGENVYRSPVSIQNNVFNALPNFQPRLSSKEQQKIVDSYRRYPTQRESIQKAIVSLGGSKDAEDLAPYFSRFRVPSNSELRTITCEMSKQAFGLSGAYQKYDPIVAIVP